MQAGGIAIANLAYGPFIGGTLLHGNINYAKLM